MAGLYAIIGKDNPASRIDRASQRLRFFTNETALTSIDSGFAATWVSSDDARLFGPAFDPQTGVRVVTSGRLAWEEFQWIRAETLVKFEGGLSNRLVLAEYLENGLAAISRPNGPVAMLIWDPRSRTVHLITDHMGYHPVFLYHPESDCVVSTLPDVISADEVNVSCDLVSMAEFLRAWRTTPPHTYYKEIKHAGAGCRWSWNLNEGSVKRTVYWQPFQDDKFLSLADAVDELSDSVAQAIRIRTLSRLGPIATFISGGMDSRALLFACADPSAMVGINLYDVPNQESRIAQRLCEASGVRYIGFGRDTDYYPRLMSQGAKLSGGMWSLEDNHFIGTREVLNEVGARTVLTACTADWVFKGYGLEKNYRKLFGRNIPLLAFANERVDGFLPNYPRPSPSEFAEEINTRMSEYFAGTPKHLASDNDRLVVEDRRIRPACYTPSVSGQIMYRTFPYDTFLSDRRVVDCYSRVHANWKLNAELWGLAIARICHNAQSIVDANFGWNVGSSQLVKLAAFGVGWCRRRLHMVPTVGTGGLATDGSWPRLGWYVQHSKTLRDAWESTPREDRELIGRLWGCDPWSIPLSKWSENPNDLFRIMTLLNHWQTMRAA